MHFKRPSLSLGGSLRPSPPFPIFHAVNNTSLITPSQLAISLRRSLNSSYMRDKKVSAEKPPADRGTH